MTEENTDFSGYKSFRPGFCRCGCWKITNFFKGQYNKFIRGHSGRGKPSPNFQGGRRLHYGYWFLWMPNYFSAEKSGYVREHIFIYQEYYKVCILPWCEIHHIDGHPERDDGNRLENLQLMTKAQHLSLHKKGNTNRKTDYSGRFCCLCNGNKSYNNHWYRHENGYECMKCNNKKYRKKKKSLLL